MSRCPDFGEWTSILVEGLPAEAGYLVAAHLLDCDACRTALADARRLDAGLGSILGRGAAEPRSHEAHEDLVALAAAIARREFPPEAWACEECTEILVASIRSTKSREVQPHPRTARARLRPVWLVGALVAACLAVAVVAIGPPSQPWARAAGLRRGQLWLLPSSTVTDVERAISSGELALPRFTLPRSTPEIERGPDSDADAPRALTPRWETVRDSRPEFRWTGGNAPRSEILLLDGQRRFVGSFGADEPGRVGYPASAPALAPGSTYYWKVNLLGSAGVRASAYVGFSVLEADASRDCDRRLARVAGSPFVEAVVAERCGLYSRAAAAFDRAAERLVNPEVAARLAREIRHRQGLDRDDIRE